MVLLGASAVVADCRRSPPTRTSTSAALSLLHMYRQHASPVLERVGVRCRMRPTCSRYAEASVARHGVVMGGLTSMWRILRCGPWTRRGTVDPPPAARPDSLPAAVERK